MNFKYKNHAFIHRVIKGVTKRALGEKRAGKKK